MLADPRGIVLIKLKMNPVLFPQLDDKPVQHREVQNHESSLFKSYFEHITLLEGG
jgi:hypothetical protein